MDRARDKQRNERMEFENEAAGGGSARAARLLWVVSVLEGRWGGWRFVPRVFTIGRKAERGRIKLQQKQPLKSC